MADENSSTASLLSSQAAFFYRNFTLNEISGALGDIGTLLPIIVGLSKTGQISLTSTLIFGGFFNIVSGFIYQIPICVQPMKAISAVALASSMPLPQVVAAGFWVSAIVLLLSLTRTLSFANRILPLPLIRGIQLGTKNPAALVLFLYGVGVALLRMTVFDKRGAVFKAGPTFIEPFAPSWFDFKEAFFKASLGQLPLTLLNSVIAVSKLADDLFPERGRPVASVTSVGVCVGLMNITSAWFGSIPYCHGVIWRSSRQYRFGARTHVSVVLLGLAKILIAVIFGSSLIQVFELFPSTVLGVMLVLAGVEIASMIKDVGGTDEAARHRMVVVIVTGGWEGDSGGIVEVVRGAVVEEGEVVKKKPILG
ncbi:hypothetical protein BC829DRAFT_440795 [Chytridium lagenaria]|nr:hypothetical protein BC829DRAFT_440795 [Chytridium lagenaria]